jgi:hypothetical protein
MLLPLTKKRSIAVALLIGALGTSTCGLAYIDVQLSGPITLNQNWLELTPSKPLKIARDTHEIALFPNPPIKMVDGPPPKGGLIASDGRDAEIEAELVGGNGVTYHSQPGYEQSMTGDLYVTRHSVDFKDLPSDITYTKVRIKSSVPYPVRTILWRNYYWGWVHK